MLVKQTVEILGGRALFRIDVRTASDLAGAIRLGLPVGSVANVVSKIATGAPGSAERLQNFMVRSGTYKRRLKVGRLSQEESERTTRLASLFATAKHVLGDVDASRFLNAPHPELHDRTPLDVAETEIGSQEVEDLLWRVFYGIPA